MNPMERIRNYWFIRKGKFQSSGEIESAHEFEVSVMMLRWEENDFDREGTERRFKGNT